MADFGIRLHGMDQALSYMAKLIDASTAWGKATIGVSTSLVYAHGVETGFTRGGKLARAAGGAWYLKGALEATAPKVPGALEKALPEGDGKVKETQQKIATAMQQEAQGRVPVVSGRLRGSLRAVYPGSGADATGGDPLLRTRSRTSRARQAPVRTPVRKR
ncbi:MAG TPA: hypothetical protein VII06_09640 [Chloroflexota bacterium]|jgi:hypothetical protein